MPKVTFISHDGSSRVLEEADGVSVMQAAFNAGLTGILAECGGSMMCATCHVYVRDPWAGKLDEMSATEHEMLTMTASERKPTSRLSCQIIMRPDLDGIVVEIPEKQI
jgi:ferredoxin, 2Fe-2S